MGEVANYTPSTVARVYCYGLGSDVDLGMVQAPYTSWAAKWGGGTQATGINGFQVTGFSHSV